MVQKLTDSAIKGKVDLEAIYKMSSSERRSFFATHTDKELGKLLNKEFEKAMASKQKDALLNWAKSVFTPQEKSRASYKSVLDKINDLDKSGYLNPRNQQMLLEDLVSDKLGVSVTKKELADIIEKSKVLEAKQKAMILNPGTPQEVNTFGDIIGHYEKNLDFLKERKKMDDYLASLNPSSNLKILTSSIGRGMMLFSVKSPVLNIISNTVVGVYEALVKRIATQKVGGLNNKLVIDYWKKANKIYQATGYDMSRALDMSDLGMGGQRVLGDVTSTQGKNALRATGRFVEDIVFKQLMGAPDVAFAAAHFGDSLNINSSRYVDELVKAGKLDAGMVQQESEKLMLDAMRINPQTIAGGLLKEQAIVDAQFATFTNKSAISDASMGIRKVLNDVSGDARVGDYCMPFVKTPANVISAGLDYAGGGGIKAVYKLVKAFKNDELTDPAVIKALVQDAARAGLGLATAFSIALNIDPDDFVGAYDQTRVQIEELKNSRENVIKLGGKWISLDYFGPLAPALTAMLYAKKYTGGETGGKTYAFGSSLTGQIKNVPGVDFISSLYTTVEKAGKQTLTEKMSATGAAALSEARSRLIPSIISDMANATDNYARKTAGGTWYAKVQAGIPIWRQSLPAKTTALGEPIKTEGFLVSMLAGSRVKTSGEDPLVTELDRLSKVPDAKLNIVDFDNTTRQDIVKMQQNLSAEEFAKKKALFGSEIRREFGIVMKSKEYQAADDSEKSNLLSNAMTRVVKRVVPKSK